MSEMEQKFNNPKIESEVIRVLEKTPIPCSVEYIAQNLNLAWGTARAILLDLTVKGKIKSQKTTKSLIFWIERKEKTSK